MNRARQLIDEVVEQTKQLGIAEAVDTERLRLLKNELMVKGDSASRSVSNAVDDALEGNTVFFIKGIANLLNNLSDLSETLQLVDKESSLSEVSSILGDSASKLSRVR